MRDTRRKETQVCSDRAAERVVEIVARGKKSKPAVKTISDMIAEEFTELVS
jgi:hypothetical protein